MEAGPRRVEVAGLSLSIGLAPEVLRSGLDAHLKFTLPASKASTFSDAVRLEEGANHAERRGDEIVVRTTAADLAGGLRGMLVLALDRRRAALLHGAGVVLEGKAVLCVAPSEGGKTTLCRKLDNRVPVLSDETVALWPAANAPSLAGTFFWSGQPLRTAQGRFPLAAVCFLEKGGEGLAPIERTEALRALLSEWHLPPRLAAGSEALALAGALLATVPSHRLQTHLDTDPLPLLIRAAHSA